MEKNTFYVAMLLLFAFMGCSDPEPIPGKKPDPEIENPIISPGSPITISASIEQASDGGLEYTWSPDDKIRVILQSDTTKKAVYTLLSGADTYNGEFTGGHLGQHTKYAYYPLSAFKKIQANHLCLQLPATQQYAADVLDKRANLIAAKSNDYDNKFIFKNLCGAIRLGLTGTETISKITITSPTDNLSGLLFTNMSGEDPVSTLSKKSDKIVTLENINVTLNPETPQYFTIIVPAKQYAQDLRITVTTDLGKEFYITNQSIEVQRNRITTLPVYAVKVINFPDPVFRAELCRLYKFTQNADNTDIDLEKQENIDKLQTITHLLLENLELKSLAGIDLFKELKSLDCDNLLVSEMNLSQCTKLDRLNLSNNDSLSTIKFPPANTLSNLYIVNNMLLTDLDLSEMTGLTYLECTYNKLTHLNLTKCTLLEAINICNTSIEELDLSYIKYLEYITLNNNLLKHLQLPAFINWVYCNDNLLESISFAENSELTELYCQNNQLKSLDMSACSMLKNLTCNNNALQELNLSSCTQLTNLTCANNKLQTLDLTKNTNLTSMLCYANHLQELDLRNMSNFIHHFQMGNQKNTIGIPLTIKIKVTADQKQQKLDYANNNHVVLLGPDEY